MIAFETVSYCPRALEAGNSCFPVISDTLIAEAMSVLSLSFSLMHRSYSLSYTDKTRQTILIAY